MRSSLNALLAAGIAATTVTASVAVPPPPGPKPLPIVIRRDLAIESLNLTLEPTTTITAQSQVATIEIVAKDWCKAPGQLLPYVTVDIALTKGGKGLATVAGNIPMKDGTGHLSLSVAEFDVPASAYFYVQIDTKNEVAEVTENNNYMSRNPNTAPFPPSAAECKPK